MKITGSRQVVGGAVLSYILIFLNTFYGLVLTPYIISTLGTVEYGIYKTIGSLSSSLMVMDLGIGGTVSRYIARYRAEKRIDEIPNFLAMMVFETAGILIIVFVVCLGLYSKLGSLYADTFTLAQIALAKRLFVGLTINMGLTIVENVVDGIVSGSNDFVFLNGLKLVRLLCRILLLVVILNIIPSSLTLVVINICLTGLSIAVEIVWVFVKKGVKIKYSKWDRHLFSESLEYTILMLAATIINQVNGNLDNIFIGMLVGAEAVTVYSIGLTIHGMFEQLSTSVSGVMLPTITNALINSDGMDRVRGVVVKCGRAQLMFLGAAYIGFVILGDKFVSLWLGTGYKDVYFITLILMTPCIFSATVNVCISILRAQNKLAFRTVVLLCTTIVNALITYFGTKMFGYYAAAIGTAFSLIVGVIIIINIYYSKVFGFSMLSVYRGIFQGIAISAIGAGIPTAILHRFVQGGWGTFILCVAVYIITYIVLLLLIGLNDEEKEKIRNITGRNKTI